MSMIAAYHLAALVALTLAALFWGTGNVPNMLLKIAMALMAAWSAVFVAKDWLA